MDTVSAKIFGGEAGRIGSAQNFGYHTGFIVDGNHTDADAHFKRLVAPGKTKFVNGIAQDINYLLGFIKLTVQKQDTKLVAAQPGQRIWFANFTMQ